ncbi:MAG TPA: L-histidine N(alpha)-methyltransferase [Gracilimonas sp.]|uniref:L-histidine N(alpha)-methyltransferase n=1 Tax=Gracilimonas sp. TaxID=1974203 RepID=UPI002DADF569|nr:L-histidine N(alpha)-methyltransferase [Gracilimonas sp.]
MNTAILEKKASSTMLADVLEGLKKPQKTLSSKYFYDMRGSELFEEISDLDEYYLTRAELGIMEKHIHEITAALGERVQLVELGSGSSLKTRLLLNHLDDIHSYVPVDISADFLDEVAINLQKEYPDLNIEPVAADYTQPFDLPETPDDVTKIAYFPGSTIGNFTKQKAADFIGLIADLLGDEGGLLIGFDLIKDRQTLIDAYDDSEGVTADFNKNILIHLNRELEADFDVDQFEHKAVFNEEESRIEMHLVSLKEQSVFIDGNHIHFEKGETIHTENSHKYSLESFRELTGPYFNKVQTWMDEEGLFAIQYLR